jgi:hypothetical protein
MVGLEKGDLLRIEKIRSRRMITYQPRIATTVLATLEKRLEVLGAFRTLALQEDEQFRQRRTEIAALRHELEQMAQSLPEICGEWASSVNADLGKYDPDQPRVPTGNPEGGQWTSGASTDVLSIIATARRMNIAATSGAYQKCLDLCYPLLERFQAPGSDRNTWDFHKCMNACLGR